MTLQELKADLLADGIIDAEEVAKLKEILYADGVIDKEEAEFLFEINDAVTGKDNDPAWESFFIQAISARRSRLLSILPIGVWGASFQVPLELYQRNSPTPLVFPYAANSAIFS
jgi:hypothetical protein